MTEQALLISDDGHVRTLRLNRPEKKNALSQALAWGIVEAVDEAARDDGVRVIAITGTGDAFCSGVDLTPAGDGESRGPMSPQTAYLDDLGWVGHFPLAIRERCDKPVVAGLNGVAAGAGLALAMACDIRLMAASAWLVAGYARIGASPDAGLSWTLPQAIGYEQAMRFLLENRSVGAEEALRLGMVSEVAPDAEFSARLREYCRSLAMGSPIAARLTKRVLRRATAIDLEALLRYELQSIGRAFASEDGREGRRAFVEKRDPEFTGR